MSIEIEYLEEPNLQFGDFFEHEDTKTGLAEFGPFGKSVPGLHPAEIRIGFVGTRETISKAREWIGQCSHYIESENVMIVQKRVPEGVANIFGEDAFSQSPALRRLNKIINRDFVGFNRESSFQSCFEMNSRWDRAIDPRELTPVLDVEDKAARIRGVVELIEGKLASIVETGPVPDVVVIALTPEIERRAQSVQVSGSFYLNLRRAIKACVMRQRNPVPVQLIRWSTLIGRRSIQEVATRAWNFCTAQYYKAGGIPWRPVTLEEDTCYIGISFFVAQDEDDAMTMRSSIALAFDFMGQGLVLRGDRFRWDSDKQGRSPHLTQEAARKLIRQILEEYVKARKTPPRRVVVHKTSEFWGRERGNYNEIDGLYEGIDDIYSGCETDFVAMRQTGIRLFREGMYPPLRGTCFSLEGEQHFLYTMGFIPYLETYPRPHVPEPWQIIQHIGGSAPKDLFREVLALTKMNMNNCAFADGAPITISFSRKVGEIMKHVSPNGILQPDYRFYM